MQNYIRSLMQLRDQIDLALQYLRPLSNAKAHINPKTGQPYKVSPEALRNMQAGQRRRYRRQS